MRGAVTPSFLAEVAIPSAWACLHFAGPFLAVAAVWWLIGHTDQIIRDLFPHWEWEKKLGWLNIQAQRRADATLRWIGYFFYAMLAVALYGIVWCAQGLSDLPDWSDPYFLGALALRGVVLLFCLGFWSLYLGGLLLPQMRQQYEMEELEKFRAEMKEAERTRERNSPSRPFSPPPKPRVNWPPLANRPRPRR